MPKFKGLPSITEPLIFSIGETEYKTHVLPERLDRAIAFSKSFKDDADTATFAKLLPRGIALFLADTDDEVAVFEEALRKEDFRELTAVYAWIFEVVNDEVGKKDTAGK